MEVDSLLRYADLIGYGVIIVGFFVANKYSADRNAERQNDAITRLCELITDVHAELKEARASGSKEHQAMIETLSENQKVMIAQMTETNKSMAEEHKEMIKISGKQNEHLVSIKEKLDAHVGEERRK